MRTAHRKSLIAIVLLIGLGFVAGIGAVLRVMPDGDSTKPTEEKPRFLSPDGEVLQYAFTGELSLPVLDPPVDSLDDIRDFNQDLFTPVELFWEADRHIRILGAERLTGVDVEDVLRVDFLFNGKPRKAYAYATPGRLPSSPVVLLTPGSGENQARKIVTGEPENYHCCLHSTLESTHRYVLIKPNHGLRSQHDGMGRLSHEFIINWHINTGSAYSAAYTVELIALKLYLEELHAGPIVLAGLSQGAKASLVAALVSPPDGLVVAAGYSAIRHDLALWSGHTQFMIPGMYQHTNADHVAREVRYPALFTYGDQEYGIHKIEADTGYTCDLLKSNPLISCEIHDVAHAFPEERIVEFISSL